MGATVEGSEGSGGDSEEEEEEEEEEGEPETSELSARKKSAASEDEDENSKSSQGETQVKRRRVFFSSEDEESTLCWVPTALAAIKAVDAYMVRRSAWIAHPSPNRCLPDLKKVRQAATLLVKNTDAAISLVNAQQSLLDKKALEGQLSALRQELAQTVERSQAEYRNQVQHARSVLAKQSTLFHREKESLKCSFKLEKEALIAQHTQEQSDLKRQLEEERDKAICCVCHDKPRDTIILPCLHFQYCFSCLLRHRDVNSNTCPTCRGPIQGLSMSSYLVS